MLAIFVAALIVLVMLTNALSRSVRSGPLGKPDRILGGAFGVLCAWVALGTAFLFYGYLGPRQLPPAVEGAAAPSDCHLERWEAVAAVRHRDAARAHLRFISPV